jgi:hypothetical protein
VRRECDDSQKRLDKPDDAFVEQELRTQDEARRCARSFEYARAYTGHLHKIRGRARYSDRMGASTSTIEPSQAPSHLRRSRQLKSDILNFRAD